VTNRNESKSNVRRRDDTRARNRAAGRAHGCASKVADRVHVRRLILEGVSKTNADRLARAIKRALSERLNETHGGCRLRRRVTVNPRGADVTVGAMDPPEVRGTAIGLAVARALEE
jgi:hypothetical protein